MATVDFAIGIGGEAGQGIATPGDILARIFARRGLHLNAYNAYQSIIRGGHTFLTIRTSDDPVTNMGDNKGGAIRVIPIADADVAPVAEFLHAELNSNVSARAWARAMNVPWKVDAPNHGFALVGDGRVVGAYLALYSERTIDGRAERFCNLGAWCVAPEYRFHSVKLLKALLAQEGYHFTDMSPSRIATMTRE